MVDGQSDLGDEFEEAFALPGAETLYAAAVRDADVGHQLVGADLAGAGQRLEETAYRSLFDDRVAALQHLVQGDRSQLERGQELPRSRRTAIALFSASARASAVSVGRAMNFPSSNGRCPIMAPPNTW
ncbi:hypothetical protein ASE03_30820 [Kitasatospora sp. Root187]|nr:hypothetical protein ASE03_30820 [Kitasatospora sp. Root187]